jgi:hypothetical protein
MLEDADIERRSVRTGIFFHTAKITGYGRRAHIRDNNRYHGGR